MQTPRSAPPRHRRPATRTGLRTFSAVPLCLSLWACGGAQTAEPERPGPSAETGAEAPAPEPSIDRAALKAQFEREAPPTALQPVSVGALHGEIESDAPPTVEREAGLHRVTARPESIGDVQCYVYDDVIDTASSLHALLSQAASKVALKQVAPYPLAHDHLDPIVGVRALYHLQRSEGLVAGDYKVVVMPRPDHSVACLHDAPGYPQSFFRVASAFAKSLRPRAAEAPHTGELWSVYVDHVPMGFSQDRRYATDEGGILQTTLESMFPQVAANELQLKDRVHLITTDSAGDVIESEHIAIEAGDKTMELELKRSPKGYRYSGTLNGTPVQGQFETPEPLRSSVALEQRLRQAAETHQAAEFSQWEYHPGVDPTAATEVRYRATPETNGMRVVMQLGQVAMTATTDAHGRPNLIEMPVGPRTVRMRVIERSGDDQAKAADP